MSEFLGWLAFVALLLALWVLALLAIPILDWLTR